MLILSIEEPLRATIYVIVFRNIVQALLGCDGSREQPHEDLPNSLTEPLLGSIQYLFSAAVKADFAAVAIIVVVM